KRDDVSRTPDLLRRVFSSWLLLVTVRLPDELFPGVIGNGWFRARFTEVPKTQSARPHGLHVIVVEESVHSPIVTGRIMCFAGRSTDEREVRRTWRRTDP